MKKEIKTAFSDIVYDVNAFSFPLIFNSVFHLLISMILTSIVGRISVGAIISTEIIDTINYAIVGIVGVGTLIFNMESSKVGTVNETEFLDWFKSCYLINAVIGLLVVLAIFLFSKTVFYYAYNLSGEELDISCKYSYAVAFSVLANMIIFSMSNLLKVKKKTKYILLAGVVSSLLQVLIAYFLVYKVLVGNYKLLGVGISQTLAIFV